MKKYYKIDNFDFFIVIGDLGCDGLDVEIMSIFKKALTSKKSNFAIISGDIVPYMRIKPTFKIT